jgi:hypothetical protein
MAKIQWCVLRDGGMERDPVRVLVHVTIRTSAAIAPSPVNTYGFLMDIREGAVWRVVPTMVSLCAWLRYSSLLQDAWEESRCCE